MKALLSRAFELAVSTVELSKYMKEEREEYPLIRRLIECGADICISLRTAYALPEGAQALYAKAMIKLEEYRCLFELMVKTDFLTALQSKPLLSDCDTLKAEIQKLLPGDAVQVPASLSAESPDRQQA